MLKWRRVWTGFALRFCAAILALATLVPLTARAEGPAVASSVGRQASGLPGVGLVAFASDNPRSLVLSGSAGYAFTESLANEVDGGHHRAMASVALAVQPLRFLAGALQLDGRFEKHPDDVLGSSSTTVGEPRLILRAASGVSRSFAIGAQLDLLVPGAEVPSLKPDASRLDARALATFAPEGSGFAAALNAGYRRDGTANILEPSERTRLRTGDALTFGLSDFDAIVLGLGASKRLDAIEIFGELGWDVLVGKNAPSATESPIRIGAGARYHVKDTLQLEGLVDVSPSGRPTVAAFVPIEPRIAVLLGARYILPFDKPPAAESTTPKPPIDTTQKPAVVAVGIVSGHVKSESGDPIANAHVTAGESAADTTADGSFKISDVKAGRVHVTTKAAGFDDVAIDVDVDAKKTTAAELVMKKTIKPGQLRGLVRSFNGKALVATIRVEPIGTEVKTDTDGTFTIDVPPGAYEVSITAPGHASQKRPVQVEENGVTVLNADLRPGGAGQ